MHAKDQTFVGQRNSFDGGRFESCQFTRCELVYSGGEPPVLSGNRFDDCRFAFAGAAERTLGFMAAMYNGMGFEGRQILEVTFDSIRRGALPTAALRQSGES